jgi:hypothetical protein
MMESFKLQRDLLLRDEDEDDDDKHYDDEDGDETDDDGDGDEVDDEDEDPEEEEQDGDEDNDNDENDEDGDDLLIQVAPAFLLEGFSTREWHVLPRSSHWRESYFLFEEVSFKASFRMTRQSFHTLHALLQPHIEMQQTHLRPTIPSKHRLAIFVYHIAQGDGYTSLSNQFGFGKSTVSVIIRQVSRAIVEHLMKQYIRFPNVDEAFRSMEFWRTKNKIPGVVACIDGSHIPIIQPAHSAAAYCNRKGFYSINMQGIPTGPEV